MFLTLKMYDLNFEKWLGSGNVQGDPKELIRIAVKYLDKNF